MHQHIFTETYMTAPGAIYVHQLTVPGSNLNASASNAKIRAIESNLGQL